MGVVDRWESKLRRKKRIRKKIRGTPDKPRLCVFRSSRHIYAQIIDDTTGRTLAQASSLEKDIDPKIGKDASKRSGAILVGTVIAERAKEKNIGKVVFDRNGFLYHGRVKALSEAARENGLVF